MASQIEIIEEVKEETHFFEELSSGDIFKDGKGDYYMRLGNTSGPSGKDWFNSIKLETGSFTFFHNESRVYPFKKIKITVYK